MLRFKPQYELTPWGGRRFEFEFGRTLPEGLVGESWEMVDLGDRQSQVLDGPHAGKLLGTLWQSGALGGSSSGAFPFLLKWLIPETQLSVQVHPNEAICEKLQQGQPKTEAWFVAQAEPDATLLVGHYPGLDAATLRLAAQGGTIQKWLYEISPRVGDFILIPAGTLHAAGAGLVLLEVQQPSTTTFRVYDWGRMGLDGQLRPLHLDEACQSVQFERFGAPKAQRNEVVGPCFRMQLVKLGTELPAGPLRVFVAQSGPVNLAHAQGETFLEYGDVVVAEPEDGVVRIASGNCIWISEP